MCRLHCFPHLKCCSKDKASHIRGFICLSPFFMYFLHLLSCAVFPKIKEPAKQTPSIFYFSYTTTVSCCCFFAFCFGFFLLKENHSGKDILNDLTKPQKMYKKVRKNHVCVTEYLTIKTDWRMSSSGPLTAEKTLRHWRVSKEKPSW